MHYLIRQKISLQLLSLYLLFVIPVLLGGAGLYVFQASGSIIDRANAVCASPDRLELLQRNRN